MGFDHCRGCKLERDRAERMSAMYQEEKSRRIAIETKVSVEKGNLALLRKRVDGCSILRLWCEYTRRQQQINRLVRMQYIGAIQRHLKLKMLWKWRAMVREKAWLTENAAATEAAYNERSEVARLRETVYLIQEDLTSIETTRHRMANALVVVRKRKLRAKALWAWREAVEKETLKMPTLVAQLAIKWRYLTAQRARDRIVEAWAIRVLRWHDKLVILKFFCTWRRRAGLPVILHSYRSQLEALQASTKLLHMEQTALRQFKAMVLASDAKVQRRGHSGQMSMQEFVELVQGKVSQAVVAQAMEVGDTGPHIDQYGIGGAVADLAQEMESMGLDFKQVNTPRGGTLVAKRDTAGVIHVNYTPSVEARRALRTQMNGADESFEVDTERRSLRRTRTGARGSDAGSIFGGSNMGGNPLNSPRGSVAQSGSISARSNGQLHTSSTLGPGPLSARESQRSPFGGASPPGHSTSPTAIGLTQGSRDEWDKVAWEQAKELEERENGRKKSVRISSKSVLEHITPHNHGVDVGSP